MEQLGLSTTSSFETPAAVSVKSLFKMAGTAKTSTTTTTARDQSPQAANFNGQLENMSTTFSTNPQSMVPDYTVRATTLVTTKPTSVISSPSEVPSVVPSGTQYNNQPIRLSTATSTVTGTQGQGQLRQPMSFQGHPVMPPSQEMNPMMLNHPMNYQKPVLAPGMMPNMNYTMNMMTVSQCGMLGNGLGPMIGSGIPRMMGNGLQGMMGNGLQGMMGNGMQSMMGDGMQGMMGNGMPRMIGSMPYTQPQGMYPPGMMMGNQGLMYPQPGQPCGQPLNQICLPVQPMSTHLTSSATMPPSTVHPHTNRTCDLRLASKNETLSETVRQHPTTHSSTESSSTGNKSLAKDNAHNPDALLQLQTDPSGPSANSTTVMVQSSVYPQNKMAPISVDTGVVSSQLTPTISSSQAVSTSFAAVNTGPMKMQHSVTFQGQSVASPNQGPTSYNQISSGTTPNMSYGMNRMPGDPQGMVTNGMRPMVPNGLPGTAGNAVPRLMGSCMPGIVGNPAYMNQPGMPSPGDQGQMYPQQNQQYGNMHANRHFQQRPPMPINPHASRTPKVCNQTGSGRPLLTFDSPSTESPRMTLTGSHVAPGPFHNGDSLEPSQPKEGIVRQQSYQPAPPSFPGPLIKDQTLKKDVLEYCKQMALAARDDSSLIDRGSTQLLWNFLHLLVRNNGTYIGSDIAELLLEGYDVHVDGSLYAVCPRTKANANMTEQETIDRFRQLVMFGNVKEAVNWATSSGLWGHALLLSSKISPRIHAQVVSRFTSTSMTRHDPLQTLYQLMSSRQPSAATHIKDEWGSWRHHLAVMICNPSEETELSKRSITALGDSLAAKGLLHASQFCYLMADLPLEPYTKKSAKLSLIGVQSGASAEECTQESATELTEIYEYAKSLAGDSTVIPHLQICKFYRAIDLLGKGQPTEALAYLEAIANKVTDNTHLFSSQFLTQLYELSKKLQRSNAEKYHDGAKKSTSAVTWIDKLRLSIKPKGEKLKSDGKQNRLVQTDGECTTTSTQTQSYQGQTEENTSYNHSQGPSQSSACSGNMPISMNGKPTVPVSTSPVNNHGYYSNVSNGGASYGIITSQVNGSLPTPSGGRAQMATSTYPHGGAHITPSGGETTLVNNAYGVANSTYLQNASPTTFNGVPYSATNTAAPTTFNGVPYSAANTAAAPTPFNGVPYSAANTAAAPTTFNGVPYSATNTAAAPTTFNGVPYSAASQPAYGVGFSGNTQQVSSALPGINNQSGDGPSNTKNKEQEQSSKAEDNNSGKGFWSRVGSVFSRWLPKSRNEVSLPVDSNNAISWDKNLNKWVDTGSGDTTRTQTMPPSNVNNSEDLVIYAGAPKAGYSVRKSSKGKSGDSFQTAKPKHLMDMNSHSDATNNALPSNNTQYVPQTGMQPRYSHKSAGEQTANHALPTPAQALVPAPYDKKIQSAAVLHTQTNTVTVDLV